ncbi:MAG: hypothetical protein IJV96_02565 [Clostridia bacterium]|nr:hypothetical protein [Clostridia bacterium]
MTARRAVYTPRSPVAAATALRALLRPNEALAEQRSLVFLQASLQTRLRLVMESVALRRGAIQGFHLVF